MRNFTIGLTIALVVIVVSPLAIGGIIGGLIALFTLPGSLTVIGIVFAYWGIFIGLPLLLIRYLWRRRSLTAEECYRRTVTPPQRVKLTHTIRDADYVILSQ